MTISLTRHFRFGVPDFLSTPWQSDWAALVNSLDNVLYGILTSDNVLVWTNSHTFIVGDLATDPISGQIWQCLVAHTSSVSPGLFSADRVAHPLYWGAFAWAIDTTGVAPIYRIVTTDAIVISSSDSFVIFNKGGAAPSTIQLGAVAARLGFPVTIVDWGNNAGDLVVTPAIGETIMGNATFTFGSGGKITLNPVIDLAGWVVPIG